MGNEKKINWNYYIKLFSKDMLPIAAEHAEGTKHIVEYFLEYIDQGSSILDIGCGRGTAIRFMQNKRPDLKIKGITLSPQEVEICRDLDVTLADMHILPYKDNFFDAIFCKDTLEHAISPPIAIAEMNRVLKLKGKLFIAIPDKTWIKDKQHIIVLNKPQLVELCHKCNFRCIESFMKKVQGYEKFEFLFYLGEKQGNLSYA